MPFISPNRTTRPPLLSDLTLTSMVSPDFSASTTFEKGSTYWGPCAGDRQGSAPDEGSVGAQRGRLLHEERVLPYLWPDEGRRLALSSLNGARRSRLGSNRPRHGLRLCALGRRGSGSRGRPGGSAVGEANARQAPRLGDACARGTHCRPHLRSKSTERACGLTTPRGLGSATRELRSRGRTV